MEFNVSPVGRLVGSIAAPPSKSYTIRAVLSGLLADGVSKIRSPLMSRDTEAAFNACRLFGGEVSQKGDAVEIVGTAGKLSLPKAVVDSLNSGTTIRICTALASLCGSEVALTGDESIRRRPIQPLLDALSQLGVESSSTNGCPPLKVKGPLLGGACKIRGDVSSQFITAVLMAAPYAKKEVTVELTSPLKSRPYVDLTLDMLGLFGVEARNDGYKCFTVPSGQTYKAAEYAVEGDYSSAAFIIAAAALTESNVEVKNLSKDSLQADRKILEIISMMGAKVKVSDGSVTVVSDGRLKGLKVDLSDSPDLLPIASVLGALAEGKTEIVNAAHARLKECDRIKAMATELKMMGAQVKERQDGLEIVGGLLVGARVEGWLDHRVVMALAVAGLKAKGQTVISGAEHIDVTFPEFKNTLNTLGAKII
ncbi:MAG: 3-phosphoshikimate 1-carboxyvinyltransferase [Candidatus Altiarchaeota archaeon]